MIDQVDIHIKSGNGGDGAIVVAMRNSCHGEDQTEETEEMGEM